jgi:DNA-binding NarL/FixJ family response regulator
MTSPTTATATAVAPPAEADTAPTRSPRPRQRIAIVEDDPALRETLAAMLGECADVEIVLSTAVEAEADRWLGEHYADWDVAIVDVFIQAGNGIRLLGAHRHRPAGRRIAIFTGFATPQARASCELLGADAVFDKTCDLEALIRYCSADGGLRPRQAS